MIEFSNVHLRYPYEQFELFKGATFTLCDGPNTVLCDTQSGKTSLCRLLIKDVAPTCGSITVDGQDIASISHAHLDILYLSAQPVFFEGRSILYNVAYPLKVRKVPKRQRLQMAAEQCQRLCLADMGRKTGKLSPDVRKQTALARGLTVPRKTVLWDDFCRDKQFLAQCMQLFGDVTHVIVTSDPRLAVGNTVVLDGGVAVFQGDADEAVQVVSQLHWLSNLES